jgi:hypothetical protein
MISDGVSQVTMKSTCCVFGPDGHLRDNRTYLSDEDLVRNSLIVSAKCFEGASDGEAGGNSSEGLPSKSESGGCLDAELLAGRKCVRMHAVGYYSFVM